MNNNHKFRFAVLTGVSSNPQAREDKGSLEDQEKTARFAGIQQGGTETAGPFVLDGYSRHGYVNLSDALEDIPPLADAVEAAIQNKYDVLIMDNIERMGDLAPMLSTLFKQYSKQLHSARQSGRIHDPRNYDPTSDEAGDIMINVEGIIQKYRNNKLRRGYKLGMPKRVKNGLPALRISFAYRWVSPKEPPALEPLKGALVIQMANLLMSGRSMQAVARHADASGIAPPGGGKKWDSSTIRYILANPFYAGIVIFRRTKYIHDPKRKNKKRPIAQPRSNWETGQGKHEPLWDEARHRAIVYELDRRRQANKYYAVRFPLSGLLACSECKGKLHRRSNGHGKTRRKVLSCAVGMSHIMLSYEDGLDLVASELTEKLYAIRIEPVEVQPANSVDPTKTALDELSKRRKRIHIGYESGIYNEAEAAEKLSEIEKQVDTLERQAEEKQRRDAVRADFVNEIEQYLPVMETWIRKHDPAVVNRLISALCEHIIIHPDHTVDIKLRT